MLVQLYQHRRHSITPSWCFHNAWSLHFTWSTLLSFFINKSDYYVDVILHKCLQLLSKVTSVKLFLIDITLVYKGRVTNKRSSSGSMHAYIDMHLFNFHLQYTVSSTCSWFLSNWSTYLLWNSKTIFTITAAEVLSCSLADFHCHYAHWHMNLQFMWCWRKKQERTIWQFVIIVKNKLILVFHASVL